MRAATDALTFAELLRARAQEQGDRIGYTFLDDGEQDEQPLTYGQADERAAAIAASLRAAGVRPGSRAILVLPPGLDYLTAFFGCLYAGVVAVPVYPPDPFQLDRSLPRLLAIVRDAGPAVALTTSPLLGFLDQVTGLAPELGDLRWLAVDDVPAGGDGDPEPVAPQATALLQYTSGSTSAPRGVMLSHANLLHNSGVIQRLFRTTPQSRGMVWLPPYHDMGLIGGLLQPLYGGLPVTLMSPLHFLEDPLRWLRAISRFGATVSGGPNFAYDLCVRKSDPEQVAGLDLSTWRVAFNGAEPIRPQTLRRFATAFAPAGFRPDAFLPCYGLAEATLIVAGTGGRRAPGDAEPADPPLPAVVAVDRAALEQHLAAAPAGGPVADLTSCGRGAPDQRIEIVDPATATVCADDQVGEIWVAGPSVAAGYWGRPEETAAEFGARLVGGDGPFLRTGDLGFRRAGELVVTGRRKDLIIIRGQNHYPQDIELAAERSDPILRPGCTAAFLADPDSADDRLVLVHEVRRQSEPLDVAAVSARIRQAVAQEHGLRVHTVVLVRAGGMPKTSSGKVQRRQCRTRLLAGDLPEVGRVEASAGAAAESPAPAESAARPAGLEDFLRERVAGLVGADPADLDRDAPLLAAGLDSLAVVQLKQAVEAELGLPLSLPAVLAGASLAALAEQLAEPAAAKPAVEPAAGSAAQPAAASAAQPAAGSAGVTGPAGEIVAAPSAAQRRMWFLQQLEPASTAYTIAVALRLPEPVDRAALRRALDALVARHPALRTTFPVRDDEPVQLVRPDGQAALREHDAGRLDDATLAHWLTRAARKPFDLRQGPLLRLDLYRYAGGEALLVTMHHIIADFLSLTVLARDLGAFYTAYAGGVDLVLPPVTATFLDVVAWQRSLLADPAQADRLTSYWDTVVGDGVPRLALPPVDHPRPDRGGSRYFALPPVLAAALHKRAAAEKVTPYVLLLATFQALLHGLTGQDDLVIGSSAAARGRPEFAGVVGCCTNPVMVRSTVTPAEPFRELLARTRRGVIGAIEHQDYPMMMLAARHGVRRGSLFDVLFAVNRSLEPGDDLAAVAFVGPPGVRRSLGPLVVERFPLPAADTGLPLEMVLAEVDGVAHGVLRYRGDALDAAGAERLVARYQAMLETVVTDPLTPVGELAGRTAVTAG